MVASASIYAQALHQAWTANIDLASDTLNMALLGSGYTPNLTADTHWSDISSHEITGTGYTAGGVSLSSVSLAVTAANSWGVSWAASTAYGYGTIVIPASPNGLLYRCSTAGTSGSSAPAWPTTTGQVVTDGTAKWTCLSEAVMVFTSDTVSWPDATFSANYAVIYDAQSGTPSAEPLIIVNSFGVAQSPSAETFEVIPDPNVGWWVYQL